MIDDLAVLCHENPPAEVVLGRLGLHVAIQKFIQIGLGGRQKRFGQHKKKQQSFHNDRVFE